ncbi:MAG: hypothetical protein J6V70_00340 [Kiritimatiellae bacterium]|nr:hypothetical protein [Kiritimatiellia bacterium]
MKYRNTKTNAIIDVQSKITGGNWQALESASEAIVVETEVEIEEKKPVKKRGKKAGE